MTCATYPDMTGPFNSQTHIDDIEEGIRCTQEHKSDKFTFMLKHKHFDLSHGEILFVEKVKHGYDTVVMPLEELDTASAPCMWMYENGWKPFAYTKYDLGFEGVPDIKEGNYNVGIRWLNNGGVEHTDDLKRRQWVRPDDDEGTPITTLANFLEISRCVTRCELTMCRELRVGKGHRCSHVCPHYKEEGGKIRD